MFDLIYRYDPAHPAERRAPPDADEACRRLEEGNRLFASTAITVMDGFRIVPVDLEDIGVSVSGGVLQHNPFAAVLGCSDARAPTELIFDRACNELFVVRVKQRFSRSIAALGRGQLSVSAGIAEFRTEMIRPEELIDAADRSLYEAKSSSRASM